VFLFSCDWDKHVLSAYQASCSLPAKQALQLPKAPFDVLMAQNDFRGERDAILLDLYTLQESFQTSDNENIHDLSSGAKSPTFWANLF